MPTIFKQKGSPFWYADLRIRGKRKQVSLRTKDKREAHKRLKQLSARLAQEFPSALKKRSLDQFTAEYLIWAKPPQKARRTYVNEESLLNRLKAWNLLPDLSVFDRRMADQFLISLRVNPETKHTLAAASLNSYMVTLRSIFSVAVEWRYLERNPFSRMKKLVAGKKLPRILEPDEVTLVFQAVQQHDQRLYDFVIFYLSTGARRGEALKLQWKDCFFEKSYVVLEGKRSKQRVVPMGPTLRSVLERRRHLEQPFAWKSDEWLGQRFRQICQRVGLQRVSIKTLRKAYATRLHELGLGDFFIQQILGHEERDVTSVYVGFPQAIIDKVALAEKAFGLK